MYAVSLVEAMTGVPCLIDWRGTYWSSISLKKEFLRRGIESLRGVLEKEAERLGISQVAVENATIGDVVLIEGKKTPSQFA